MAATTSPRSLRIDARVRAAGLLFMIAPAATAAGCAREPAEALCPDLAEGDLVITEIRGIQTPSDDAAPWVEVYNASGRAIDLLGIRLAFIDGSGIAAGTALVRRSLPTVAGDYVVLGLFDDAARPPNVDYGFFLSDGATWSPRGKVTISSCDAPIDDVRFELPTMGTYSLGGAPDADRNDYTTSWCADRTKAGTIYPGAPGQPNIPCS